MCTAQLKTLGRHKRNTKNATGKNPTDSQEKKPNQTNTMEVTWELSRA